MSDFPAFPKIARLSKPVVLTEKIDGTNGLIHIEEVSGMHPDLTLDVDHPSLQGRVSIPLEQQDGSVRWFFVRAGSRSRWITPQNDNHGFARWVHDNAEELVKLGPGHHYGEWWGAGIQRGYGMQKGQKFFSLFNVGRWRDSEDGFGYQNEKNKLVPAVPGLRVVPVIASSDSGEFISFTHNTAREILLENGSAAARREGVEFDRPEGLMVYFEAANVYMKAPFDDGRPKGVQA